MYPYLDDSPPLVPSRGPRASGKDAREPALRRHDGRRLADVRRGARRREEGCRLLRGDGGEARHAGGDSPAQLDRLRPRVARSRRGSAPSPSPSTTRSPGSSSRTSCGAPGRSSVVCHHEWLGTDRDRPRLRRRRPSSCSSAAGRARASTPGAGPHRPTAGSQPSVPGPRVHHVHLGHHRSLQGDADAARTLLPLRPRDDRGGDGSRRRTPST